MDDRILLVPWFEAPDPEVFEETEFSATTCRAIPARSRPRSPRCPTGSTTTMSWYSIADSGTVNEWQDGWRS